MTYPYRCTHDDCRRRVALPRKIERYTRDPKCPDCGRALTGSVDRAKRRENERKKCECSGYWFPHRAGSKWCVQSARPLTDQDHEQRCAA